MKAGRCTVFTTLCERLTAAEERLRYPFANRTNIYRCEDGRPICYCCPRVGHVAKYCWDRRYSCPHNWPNYTEETPLSMVSVDLDSLERDVNKMLKELQGITHDLKLSRTPFRAGSVEDRTEEAAEHCKETDNFAVNPATKVQEPCTHLYIDAGPSSVPLCHKMYTAPDLMYLRDAT